MGMTIDESIGWMEKSILDMRRTQICISDRLALETAIETMRKYQQLQADYENRLKADMVAMLEDLKKEMNPIKECEYQIYGKEHWNFAGKCQDIVQQKIDKLRGEESG